MEAAWAEAYEEAFIRQYREQNKRKPTRDNIAGVKFAQARSIRVIFGIPKFLMLLFCFQGGEMIGKPATEASLRSESIMLPNNPSWQGTVLSLLREVSVPGLPIISQP
jgi:hypothetical protein